MATSAQPSVGSMSARWWGLRWADELPWQIGELEVRVGDFEEAATFVASHQEALFGPKDERWLRDELTEAKVRFYLEADVFVFSRGDLVVGVQVGHPTDWNSYYVRSVALLPECRGSGFVQAFSAKFCDALARAGVQRVEGDIPPVNVANFVAQVRSGYVPTGTINSDRWGTVIRLTKHLSHAAEVVFRHQFCAGNWPPCRGS